MAYKKDLTVKRIFHFWSPLAATWFMMAAEGPYIAAIIARLDHPIINLAAFGVAFAFALILESPIIMIMSASTALVKNRVAYFKLRNFTFLLNAAITLLWIIFLAPRVFFPIVEGFMKLPSNVAQLTHLASLLLLPWPAAIGYRRFNHGILIRKGKTRLVALGTVVRLLFMASTGLILFLKGGMPGAVVGAAALSVGVTMEALASRVMAGRSIRDIVGETQSSESLKNAADTELTYRYISTFYYPLALTSMLILAINPLVTFCLGQSRLPIESLAVLPVVNSLVFIFRSMGLAYQEVGIALLGEGGRGYPALKRFAAILGVCAAAGLAIIGWSPLAVFWFEGISGLSPALTHLALVPVRILTLMPALSVLFSFEQAMLVSARKTAPITWGTGLEVAGVAVMLSSGIWLFHMVGVTAAAYAFMAGRLCSTSFLFPHMVKAVGGIKEEIVRDPPSNRGPGVAERA